MGRTRLSEMPGFYMQELVRTLLKENLLASQKQIYVSRGISKDDFSRWLAGKRIEELKYIDTEVHSFFTGTGFAGAATGAMRKTNCEAAAAFQAERLLAENQRVERLQSFHDAAIPQEISDLVMALYHAGAWHTIEQAVRTIRDLTGVSKRQIRVTLRFQDLHVPNLSNLELALLDAKVLCALVTGEVF